MGIPIRRIGKIWMGNPTRWVGNAKNGEPDPMGRKCEKWITGGGTPPFAPSGLPPQCQNQKLRLFFKYGSGRLYPATNTAPAGRSGGVTPLCRPTAYGLRLPLTWGANAPIPPLSRGRAPEPPSQQVVVVVIRFRRIAISR